MAEKVTEMEEPSGGRLGETFLRVAPMGLCLAALVLMIKNAESTEYGDASYSNFTGFRQETIFFCTHYPNLLCSSQIHET